MGNICIAVTILGTMGLVFGALLGYISIHCAIEKDPIVERIDELLPQIQCGQCGYPGCLPYAEAIIVRKEKINRCIPGGKKTMLEIAELLSIDPQLIDNQEELADPLSLLAVIDESNCIGCTKCIQICPVDAIIGAKGVIHTVITDLCTGCKLCVAPCPMGCIKIHSSKPAVTNRNLVTTKLLQ